MCSHFGLNLHPDHPPAVIENRVYEVITRWLSRIRLALHRRRLNRLTGVEAFFQSPNRKQR
jgi:hypothetical protein